MQLLTATFAIAAFASSVSAHATMFGVHVNGQDQGDGRFKYIRSPPNNSPVKDLASPDIVCGPNGGRAVSSFVKAAAGDKIEFEWFHDNRNDDIIDGSHVGPIITYVAPYTEGNGVGSIWTKIAEDGFSNGVWAVDKIKRNNGKQAFTLPAALKAGKYLIRQEIIALHEGDAAFNAVPARGAQFYPSCVQFEVTGSGTVVPTQNFNFNTGYTYSDPGIVFNIYRTVTSYPIPGPAVFNFGAGGSAPVSTSPAVRLTTTSVAAVRPTTTSVVAVRPTSTLVTSVRQTTTTKAAPVTRPTRCPGKKRRTVVVVKK
ncbi:endo-beta-1,4-glucanase D [Podospora fimiseda]|uniref:lytic cellulose monooxygenase (C4-dehydrogenating) n=1 Tax=Podospora fimiseda TaxID=252190 RepID=A0AAN7BVY6_9PEZI|nr:endo-beta-1,4-glucanase D [Podospora fimiseda]